MIINQKKQVLRDLILAILTRTGEVPKVKLAKLILFAEIEHYKKTGNPITGLYFVRLKKGPVIAFYDDILEEGEGIEWDKRDQPIQIKEEGRDKVRFLYKARKGSQFAKETESIIDKVVREYGKLTGTKLALLSHELPAWRHAEPNEPISLAELSVVDEKEYFALIEFVEELEEPDDFLAEELSSALPKTESGA